MFSDTFTVLVVIMEVQRFDNSTLTFRSDVSEVSTSQNFSKEICVCVSNILSGATLVILKKKNKIVPLIHSQQWLTINH